MRVELSNDGWAELLDPKRVSERKRRPLTTTLAKLTPEAIQALKDQHDAQEAGETINELAPALLEAAPVFLELTDIGVVAFVDDWSFVDDTGTTLPITVDSLLDLPGEDYDRLQIETAPLVRQIITNFDPTPDPDSPTVPSLA